MSRLIVKGLPESVTEKQLKEHFSRCGRITDVQLKRTPTGKFRRFGFIGYASEKQAKEAVSYFHNTYMGSSQMDVQIAKPYGSKEIPRPWSQYSEGSSAYREKQAKKNPAKDRRTKELSQSADKERQQRLYQDQHKSKLMSMLSEYYELESDPEFAEFMAAHKNQSVRYGWTNDENLNSCGENKSEVADKEEHDMSDMDYLHSKGIRAVKEEKDKELCPWGKKQKGDEVPIAESGRLFLRNLSYSATEDDLTELFSKYGPITEMKMLVDKESGQPIGIAFISFMFPEHAVKAAEELDGQIFQGRLLHILPGRPRRVKDGEKKAKEGKESSYKKQKAKQLKKDSEGGHNWNSLFLGSNAVVDVMADQYSTTKSTILDADTAQSLAVRMALGETQLVAETGEFLENNGIKLDAQQPKRSKTIILVKNLPFGTTGTELNDLFSKYGAISRLALSPHGVSALVEYSTASNARSAFSRLAHEQFKHLPLYLEWAPLGSLGEKSPSEEVNEPDKDVKLGKSASSSSRKTIKNIAQKSAKILVRNVPFEATRKELWKLFNTFGELKFVRLPQKYGCQQGQHRGFAFVEFVTKEDAKRAMEALGHSTHLYRRRLVMEWANDEESVKDVRKRTAKYFHGFAPPVKKRQRVNELLSSLSSHETKNQESED